MAALTTVDAYLTALPRVERDALGRLRALIRSAAPEAVEKIAYGLPVFVDHGHLVGFGAARAHLSFFPMDGETVARLSAELAGFSVSKGTIRFSADKPLPDGLVTRIVRERLAVNRARVAARKS